MRVGLLSQLLLQFLPTVKITQFLYKQFDKIPLILMLILCRNKSWNLIRLTKHDVVQPMLLLGLGMSYRIYTAMVLGTTPFLAQALRGH